MFRTRQEYREAWDRAFFEDPKVPLNVDIELASTCNAKCTFCLYGDRDWDQSMLQPDWDGRKKRRLMPKEIALRIIDECAEIGVPALKFNFRGESVLHPDYGEIVEHARRTHVCDPGPLSGEREVISSAGKHWGAEGYHGPAFFDLLANTNGNIPDANWDSAIRGLMACTKVMISLDSMDPETYPKIRVGLSLDRAKRTIDELVCRKHPDLWVRRVICKANKHEDFVGAVKARWPEGVKVSEHFAFDRNHYQEQELTGEDPSNWERNYCGYPSQRCVVEASGRYVACCISWEGEVSPPSMHYPETSIMEYWNSEWRRNLASELRRNEIRNPKCLNCTSFLAYKRPERAFVQDVEGRAMT